LILERLEAEGIKISRPTFMRLMKEEYLFQMKKTAGGWYTCDLRDIPIIIRLIKENYGIKD
jgi:hypothetical protein